MSVRRNQAQIKGGVEGGGKTGERYGGTGCRKEQEAPVFLVRQWPAGKLGRESREGVMDAN